MENNILSSSADSVVLLLNGSVGEIHIFVRVVIRNSVRESILVSIQRISCRSVRARGSAR